MVVVVVVVLEEVGERSGKAEGGIVGFGPWNIFCV